MKKRNIIRVFMGILAGLLLTASSYAQTFNLNTVEPSTIPSGTTLEWHTAIPVSSSNLLLNDSVVNPGIYYAVFKDSAGCYSYPTIFQLIKFGCGASGINLLASIDSTNKPDGTVVTIHTATPISSSNKYTGDWRSAMVGSYHVAYYDTAKGCYSLASTIRVISNADCPDYDPDFGVTKVNVPLNGDLSTNDDETPGSKYGTPLPNPVNPSSCLPTVAADGKYTFVCSVPGTYTFQVPVCEPAPSTICTNVPLTINVLDTQGPTSAPLANPDYATTAFNTPKTIPLTANDKCQTGPTCVLSTPLVVTAPKNGTFNPTTGVYTPRTDFVGEDSLQYQVCDNQTIPKCDTAWAYINVLSANAANSTQATDDYAQTPYNTPVSGNVKTNDRDPEDSAQTVTPQNTSIVGKGTLVLASNGSYTFTPAAGFSGPIDFVYTTCDNGTPVECASATLHIVVDAAPSHDPDFGVTKVNVPLNGDLSTNDDETPGSKYGTPLPNPVNPSSCLPTVAADGKYTFVCSVPGTYIFQVPVCEPAPSTICTNVPLTINVLDPKDTTPAPLANPDYATTGINNPVDIPLTANDKCQTGPTCVLSTPVLVTAPTNGTFNPTTGVYTPNTGFVGKDSFQYKICDNQVPSQCDTAWAYIIVEPADAPNSTQATDDYAQTPYNTSVGGNVKTNDRDPQDGTQTVTPQTTPIVGKGTLVLASNGSYTFTPSAGFYGPIDFVYTTCDNGTPVACASATLHIVVDAPPSHDPDFGVTKVNVPLNGDLSTNDDETPGSKYGTPLPNPVNPSSCLPTVAADGKYTFVCSVPGTYTFQVPVCEPAPSTICTNVPLTINVLEPQGPTSAPLANPDYATTKVNNPIDIPLTANDKCQTGPTCVLSAPLVVTAPKNGTFNPTTGVYTPNTDFVGEDSLQYQVCDNQTIPKCDTAWAYINVLPGSAANSTQATDDYAQTPYNIPVSGNVKTNDRDPEDSAQTVTPQNTPIIGKGTLVLASDGSYTFTPAVGFSGPIDFVYTTCDNGTPVECASATLHIVVDAAPSHDPDFGVTNVSVPLNGNLSTNDDETPGSKYGTPPANPSNPSSCSPVVAADGKYTFECSVPGTYTYQVPVCEPAPSTTCTNVPLTINVLDPNDPTPAPVANPDYATTKVNNPIDIPITSNDRCLNGDTCMLGKPSIVTDPINGAFNFTTGVYIPNTGFVGEDSFQYKICDNQVPSECDTAWVYIIVLPENAPNSTQATDDYAQTKPKTPVSGNVKLNDRDPEDSAQTVTPQTTTIAGKGTLVLTSDGSYTFTPVVGFFGPVDFPYTTCDNGAPVACATATLHILVTEKIPDLRPSFTFRTTTLSKGQTMNLTCNINNILSGIADPLNAPIIVIIPKPVSSSGYTLISNGTMTSIQLVNPTAVNNTDWDFTETASTLKFVLKSGRVINSFSLSKLGVTVTRSATTTSTSAFNLTATILPNSGGERNNSNNSTTIKVTSN